jgi:hypothetical protein
VGPDQGGAEKYFPIPVAPRAERGGDSCRAFPKAERCEAFYKCYRVLEELYAILSLDPFPRLFPNDYEKLTWIYQVLTPLRG